MFTKIWKYSITFMECIKPQIDFMKIIFSLTVLLISINCVSQTNNLNMDTLNQIGNIRKYYRYINDNKINFEILKDTGGFESENIDEKYERDYYYENSQLRLVTEASETITYSVGVKTVSKSELYFWDNKLVFCFIQSLTVTRDESCEYYQVSPYEAKELRYYFSDKNLIQILEKEIKSETKIEFHELSDRFLKVKNTKLPITNCSKYGSLMYSFSIEQYMTR